MIMLFSFTNGELDATKGALMTAQSVVQGSPMGSLEVPAVLDLLIKIIDKVKTNVESLFKLQKPPCAQILH